ncbi:hypothetical protein [Flavobacterium piscis]|uniref:Uncharacterized protein n=1 Tax=Flavobacterium piscis TaxID=1114874 RepID=A0ABU1Y2F5_9FLAO|nr:hypothetical protein [Flavobacterium piscis]MDR7208416.1 hypothetical protein [Flavobacterium piscis]
MKLKAFMMINSSSNSFSLNVEQFDYFKLDSQFSIFNISQNMVVFFNSENNHIIDDYIQLHSDNLIQRFKEIGLSFVYKLNTEDSLDLENVIKYYTPFISEIERQQFKFSNDCVLPASEIIIDYLGYSGNIKRGFLFFDNNSAYIVEFDETTIKGNSEEFFNGLFQFIEEKSKEEYDDFPCNPFNPYEDLDDEAKQNIKEIQSKLTALKQSGQLLYVLPILKQILNSEANSLTKSNLIVDEDYRILLPKFNNLEIQLSHLTKAVYVLFYNNPHGINIKELHIYRKALLNLYSNISYQLDYNKIQQSIDDLIEPESKAIYTHISRIKSAFCKQMDYEFAKNYIVAGSVFGTDFKYISILKESHFQDLHYDNSLSAGVTRPFTDVDSSGIFDPNEFED